MNNDILTDKLLHFAQLGNIEMDRCIEIAQAANDAIVEQSKGKGLPEVAAAMFRCCGSDEDEAAYFRCAVNSLLQERWGAKEKDRAAFTFVMNSSYEGLLKPLRTGHVNTSNRMPEVEKRDVFTSKIRPGVAKFNRLHDAVQFGISEERHQWIIEDAEAAMESYVKGSQIDLSAQKIDLSTLDALALPMLNCCNSTEEMRFFSYAVKSFLCRNGFNEENATLTTNGMGHRAIQIADTRRSMEAKKSSAGCLTVLGIVGILPLGIYGVRFLQG